MLIQIGIKLKFPVPSGLGCLRALLIQIGIKPIKTATELPRRLRALLIQIGIKLSLLLSSGIASLRALLIQIGIKP